MTERNADLIQEVCKDHACLKILVFRFQISNFEILRHACTIYAAFRSVLSTRQSTVSVTTADRLGASWKSHIYLSAVTPDPASDIGRLSKGQWIKFQLGRLWSSMADGNVLTTERSAGHFSIPINYYYLS